MRLPGRTGEPSGPAAGGWPSSPAWLLFGFSGSLIGVPFSFFIPRLRSGQAFDLRLSIKKSVDVRQNQKSKIGIIYLTPLTGIRTL
jgi:hypothetical protein